MYGIHITITQLKRIVLVVAFGTILAMSACSSDDGGASAGNESVAVDFPAYPESELLESARVDDSDVASFAGSSVVAAVYESSDDAMSVNSYYSMDKGDTGWSLRGGKGTQYMGWLTFIKGNRIAKVAMIPGRAMEQAPGKLSKVNIAPFDLSDHDVGDGESLIYTLVATCEEASIDDCVNEIQREIEREDPEAP